MNLSKIAGKIKTSVTKTAKVTKKAIQAASEEVQNEKRLQKDLDSAATLGRSIIKKSKKMSSEEAQRTIEDLKTELGKMPKKTPEKIDEAIKQIKVKNATFQEKARTRKTLETTGEGINRHLNNYYPSEIELDKKSQVRAIAREIMMDYPNLTPEEATKGAMELVNSTGLQRGRVFFSQEEVEKVFGTEKNALEKKLDLEDLKGKLMEKHETKMHSYKSPFEEKLDQIDELVSKEFDK